MTPTLAIGQTWTPAAGSRAKARTVTFMNERVPGLSFSQPFVCVGFLFEGYAKPYSHSHRPFVHGAISWHNWISEKSFLFWIRRHRATLTPPDLAAELDAVGASGLGAAT